MTRAREATDWLCQLLQGLRLEFEAVRSQLYNRDEEPTFDEAISKLMQEESRIQGLKGEIEGSVYVTKGYRQNLYPRNSQVSKKSGSKIRVSIQEMGQKLTPIEVVKMIMCAQIARLTGHLKDKCWQLHGKPPHIAKAHAVQNSQVGGLTSNSENIPSAQDFQKMMLELQHLKTLFNSSSTVIGSTSMANSGKNEIFSSLTFLTKTLQLLGF